MTRAIQVASVTRTGRRHLAEQIPNQDSRYHILLPDNRGIVAAVSDGAGSAQRSKTGSFLAVRTSVAEAVRTIENDQATPQEAVGAGFAAARKAIAKQASLNPAHPVSHYHCTLVIVAWLKHDLAALQVGDGAAIVQIDDEYKMLTVPQRGQYANETFFITQEQAPEIAFQNQTDHAQALAMFTDGIQSLMIDHQRKRANAKTVHEALAQISTPRTDSPDPAPCPEPQPINAAPITRVFGWPDSAITNPQDQALLNWFLRPEIAGLCPDDATLLLIRK